MASNHQWIFVLLPYVSQCSPVVAVLGWTNTRLSSRTFTVGEGLAFQTFNTLDGTMSLSPNYHNRCLPPDCDHTEIFMNEGNWFSRLIKRWLGR